MFLLCAYSIHSRPINLLNELGTEHNLTTHNNPRDQTTRRRRWLIIIESTIARPFRELLLINIINYDDNDDNGQDADDSDVDDNNKNNLIDLGTKDLLGLVAKGLGVVSVIIDLLCRINPLWSLVYVIV